MELRDFIVTPFVISVVYGVAYFVRPYVCDSWNYRYFFPALTVKVIGALALGFIYQFYYTGGDTFNYHSLGSRQVWNLFTENPGDAFQLIFLPRDWHSAEAAYYASSKVVFYHDPSSYFVVRVASFFDLFTFSTYSATAVLFAAISFSGCWLLFLTFYKEFPHLKFPIACAVFFIPSFFFWGSGILKDTLVITCLGAAAYSIQSIFMRRDRFFLFWVLSLLVALTGIFLVKKYVLLCFIPASLFWIYAYNLHRIRSQIARLLIVPFIFFLSVASGYYAVSKIGEDDPRYALDKLASTSRITAYDIGYLTGKDAGSGYSLGELDGTLAGMVKLAPQAINVALFRPYVWEVRNPLMLLSAIESLVLLGFTIWLILRRPFYFFKNLTKPYVIFCLVFSLTFAFAVGVSTFNFGTLVRYKIPMLPFYVLGLILLLDYSNSARKVEEFESTE